MIRLKSVSLSAVAILVFAFAGAAYGQNKPLKKVRVGVPSVGVANIIIFIAKEGKLYEKHGLDAEVITVNGSGIGSKALISGGIDIIPIATPTVIAANLAGADMQILAHTMPGVVHAMMVKPEIKRVEDLKGKKIGVSSLGSLTDFLVRTIARKKGLNPDRDLTLHRHGRRCRAVDGAARRCCRCIGHVTSRVRPGAPHGISNALGLGQGDRLSLDGNHHAPGRRSRKIASW